MENTLPEPNRAFQVDPEHNALRVSMVAIFMGIWVITFFALNAFIPSDGLNLIAFGGSLLVAAVVSRQVENRLKVRWPSGRKVIFNADGIQILHKETVQHAIKAGEPMGIVFWRFRIRRRTRVPKGWYVVACAIEQDDEYLPVYTFMSPDAVEAFNKQIRFPLLMTEKEEKKSGVKQDMLRVAGEQRRLRQAEQHRWMYGAEMSDTDFQQFVEQLNEQFPQWMPLNR